MSQQILNLGTPNQNDGDNRRTAFDKVQQNFNQLFDANTEVSTAKFNSPVGTFVGTPSVPITTVISLSTTDAVNGGIAAVYFKGATLSFSGGTVVIQSGNIIENELCLVCVMYDKTSNGFMVNIQTGFKDLPTGPAQMTITLIEDSQSGIGPAQMTITEII